MPTVNACENEARRKHDVEVAYCEPNRFRFKCNSKPPALFSFPPIIGSLAQVLARQPHIPTVTLSNICTLITLFSHQRHAVLLVHVKFSFSGRFENACLWVKTSWEQPPNVDRINVCFICIFDISPLLWRAWWIWRPAKQTVGVCLRLQSMQLAWSVSLVLWTSRRKFPLRCEGREGVVC